MKGCFFHLTQNIWRKVQGVGLQTQYTEDADLAMRIRLLPALAFAAQNEVPELLTLVAQQLPMPEASDLILYFENTYVGRFLPGGSFQAPLFSIPMWNYYSFPNSNVELLLFSQFQCGIITLFPIPMWNYYSFPNSNVELLPIIQRFSWLQHPNIWKFINALKREQGLVEFRQAKFTAGTRPR